MLRVTIDSLERHAPPSARLIVRAYCDPSIQNETRARIGASPLYVQHMKLLTPWLPTESKACASQQTKAEHRNEFAASRLLNGVRSTADAMVLWRIDTELVSPIDIPPIETERLYIPYLQNGGFLNDRFVIGDPRTMERVQRARFDALCTTCQYGETLLFDVLRTLNLSIAFTRTRLVRRRHDLYIPRVDALATLGRSGQCAAWMKLINTLPMDQLDCRNTHSLRPVCYVRALLSSMALPPASMRIFGVHGSPHACPYFRTWESRCVWKQPISFPAAPAAMALQRLLILGDSMDGQLFAAIACNLYAHRGPDLRLSFEAKWDNGIAALRKRCDSLTHCHYTSAVLRVDGAKAPFREMHLCQDDRAACLRHLGYRRTDVVITGSNALHGAAHGVRGMFVRGVMNATLAAIEARKDAHAVLRLVGSGRLVWREATAQHFSALGGHWLHGFMLRSNIERLEQRCVSHSIESLRAHSHWNKAAEPLLQTRGVPILRTWNSSALAWYAHIDHGDCTHFCQPGLVSHWADELMSLLNANVDRFK